MRRRHPWTLREYVNAYREELGDRVWRYLAAENHPPPPPRQLSFSEKR